MIQIHYPNDSAETRGALRLKKLIEESWPDIANHPRQTIHIVTSAYAHGQKRADNDMIVLFNLDEPRAYTHKTAIYDERGRASFPKEAAAKSLMMTVEIKDHPESNIALSGTSVRVRYMDGGNPRWSDATAQSIGQKNGLINHMKRHGNSYPPIVANAIWLRDYPDEKLPSPPHAILGKNATWDDYLTVAANSGPLIRSEQDGRLVITSEKRDGAIDRALDVFARDMITLEGIPSRPLLSNGTSTGGLYLPGAPRTQQERASVKGPRLVIEDAVDSLTEIALLHARRHAINAMAAASGATAAIMRSEAGDKPREQGPGEKTTTDPRDAYKTGLVAARQALGREAELPQKEQQGRLVVLGQALDGCLRMLDAASSLNPDMTRALARQASFTRSAARMLEYADVEHGRVDTLKESRSLRHIRDIGMPEVPADAGIVAAWEGFRAIALIKSASEPGLREIGDFRHRIETVARMENTQRRSEETIRLLFDTEKSLASESVSHPLLSKFVENAQSNVGFVRKWMMACASGERPEFFGPDPQRGQPKHSLAPTTRRPTGPRAPRPAMSGRESAVANANQTSAKTDRASDRRTGGPEL